MRKRIPSLLLGIGILIVALTPRLLAGAGDLVQGTAMGAGIGIELIGARMMIQRTRTSRCRRAA